MTSRNRAPRRRRVWSNDDSSVVVGTSGVPGQIARRLDPAFLAMSGLSSMFGCTIARTHVCILITSDGTNSADSHFKAKLGIGIFPEGMDNGDYPDLEAYNGNWFAYECFVFRAPGVINTVVLPEAAAFARLDYRSMRKIDSGEMLVLVMQHDLNETIRYAVSVSFLVLLP